MHAILLRLSYGALRALLSRSVSSGLLKRVCRSLYLYTPACPPDGALLFHAVNALRADDFNYISLETSLSEWGVISQIPINSISIMSSGRSSVVSCGDFGQIEFIHTQQKPSDLLENLTYDSQKGLWKANVSLAIRDMKRTRRNLDLVNWGIVNESI